MATTTFADVIEVEYGGMFIGFPNSDAERQLTVWDSQTGGIQYTALLDAGGHTISTVVADAKGRFWFQEPGGATSVWVEDYKGVRTQITAQGIVSDADQAANVNDSGSQTRTAMNSAFVQVAEVAPAIQRYRNAGDTDWNAAWSRMVAAAPKAVRIPANSSTYDLSATATIPAGTAVTIERGATVRATASIGPVFDTALGTKHTEGRFDCQGSIDCNNLAQTGLYLRWFADYYVPRLDVRSPTHGLIAGDPNATATSYGLRVDDLYVSTPNGGRAVPTGSYGLWMRYAGDSKIAKATIIGEDVGVRNDQGNNRFSRCHVWGYSGAVPSVAFDDNSADSAYYESCMADTPSTYGWRVRQATAISWLDCTVFNNSLYGTDNATIGVHFDASNPVFLWLGGYIDGTAAHRLAKDFEATAGGVASGFFLPAKYPANVATPINPSGQQASMANLRLTGLLRSVYTGINFSASDGSGVATFTVDSTNGSRRVSVYNGADTRGYTDAGTTRTWTLGNNGVGLPKFTTAGRPAASTAGAGFAIYDTTLSKPVYSDGTTWRDASGAAV